MAISSLNASIHRFWLAAVGWADTTATSPLGSGPSSRISNSAPKRPIESLVAWLTKNGRPPTASASKVTTLAPSFCARSMAGTTASGIARRHGDRRDVAIGKAVDDIDLRLGAGFRRAVVLDLAAGLLGGDLRAGQRRVVIGVGGRLDHHAQFEIGGVGRAAHHQAAGMAVVAARSAAESALDCLTSHSSHVVAFRPSRSRQVTLCFSRRSSPPDRDWRHLPGRCGSIDVDNGYMLSISSQANA